MAPDAEAKNPGKALLSARDVQKSFRSGGGLLDADGGSLLFMDRDVLHMTEKELTEYRRDFVGFVFQSYNLMPNLTAKQNPDLIAELVEKPMDSMAALDYKTSIEVLGLILGVVMGGVSLEPFNNHSTYFLNRINVPALFIGAAFTAVLTHVMCRLALRKVKGFELADINKM